MVAWQQLAGNLFPGCRQDGACGTVSSPWLVQSNQGFRRVLTNIELLNPSLHVVTLCCCSRVLLHHRAPSLHNRRWDRKYWATYKVLDILQKVFYRSNPAREAFVEMCEDSYVQKMTFDSYLYKTVVPGGCDGWCGGCVAVGWQVCRLHVSGTL